MAIKKTKFMMSERENKQHKQPSKQMSLLIITIVSLVAIALGLFSGKQANYFNFKQESINIQRDLALGGPDQLLNYKDFRELYPLIEVPSQVEDSHRKLSFNSELAWIGQVNMATLAGLQAYYLQQSPMAFSNQLSESSPMLGIYRNGAGNRHPLAASGKDIIDFVTGTVTKDGAELHRQLPIARPLVRAIVSDKRYEVPNRPLEEQTDPDKITHIDVDHRYCTGPVPDQGTCGSCYSFAFNAYIEWQFCRQSAERRHVKFSDQYILDCGPDFSPNLRGCNSGVLNDVRNFHHHNGFFLSQDYPYTAKSNWCRHKTYNSNRKRLLPNHKLFIAHSVREMKDELIDREEWERILQTRPILVGVELPGDYSYYSRGIHHGENCATKDKGHAMILIGMGRENGHPYWLLKNSMGPKWGENGYMRLSRRAPMRKCFVEGYVIEHSFLDNEEAEFQAQVEADIGPDDVAWLKEPLTGLDGVDKFEDLDLPKTYQVGPMDFEDEYEFGNKRIKLDDDDDDDEDNADNAEHGGSDQVKTVEEN